MQMTTVRLPWIGRGTLPNNGQGTYPPTGVQVVKDSVDRTTKPGPAAPAGIEALTAEIAANTARTAEIRAELVRVDGDYERSALEWDTSQLQTARLAMNAAADSRRQLQHELSDLADEMPRLQKRLEAARKAQRDAEHVEDLARLERCLDEFGPVAEAYRQCAVDLVELANELQQRRNEIMRLRRRTVDWSDHTGAPRCERDVNKEAYVPRFFAEWLDGSPRSLADAKRALGIQD